MGPTELMYIHYAHQPMAFSALERHFQVTQTFSRWAARIRSW
jgi:hypothetical protein